MKCAVCSGKIDVTFLNKIRGTYVKEKPVCSTCQKRFSISELLQKL